MSRFGMEAPAPEGERLYLELEEERVRVDSRTIRAGETAYPTREVESATLETYSPGRHKGFLVVLVGLILSASGWIAPRVFEGVLGFPQSAAPSVAPWVAWLGVLLVLAGCGPLMFGRPKSFVVLRTSRGRRVLLRTAHRERAERVTAAVNRAVDGRQRPSTIFQVGRDLTVGRDLNLVGEQSIVTVLSRDAEPGTEREPSEAPPDHRFPNLPRPAFELLVREERSGGGAALRLGLVAVDAGGETERRWFEPIGLKRDPRPLVDTWWERLEGLGAAARHRELEGLGVELGAELLPRDLARRLAGCAEAGGSLWLHSEEPSIPWELVRPPRTGREARGSHPFLCASFAMTRWQGSREPALALPLQRIGVLVPETRDKSAADAELGMLRGLAGPGREVVPLEPTVEAVTAALAGGELDGVHFCGHGLRPGQDPSLVAIPLRGETLTPRALAGRLGRFGVRRPLVFLNGCHTGRAGFTLAGTGGWASTFLDAGAGAFLGCSWGVDGETALSIAESFYRSLLGGATLGEALRRSRLQPNLGNPLTAWAYRAYGHPSARVATPR